MSILSKTTSKFVFTLFLFTCAAYFGRERGIGEVDTTVTGAKKEDRPYLHSALLPKFSHRSVFPKIPLFARGSC